MHWLTKKVFTKFHKNISSWKYIETRRQTWMDGQMGGQTGRHDKAICSFVNVPKRIKELHKIRTCWLQDQYYHNLSKKLK